MGIGLYEIATHPFATHQGSYRPPYKSNIPWIHGGYEEFPPELGFESRYRYTRSYHGWYTGFRLSPKRLPFHDGSLFFVRSEPVSVRPRSRSS